MNRMSRQFSAITSVLATFPLNGCGSVSATPTADSTDASGASTDAASGETARGPRPVGPLKRLAVGYSGACILDTNDHVACWGENPAGETGVAPNFTASLQLVAGVPAATQVVMGNTHTCALAVSGDVYCWGSNVHNQLGHAAGTQGDVTCAPPIPNSTVPCSWTPVKIGGLPKAIAIAAAAGFDSVCALVQGGIAYCWGETLMNVAGTVTCGKSQMDRCFETPTQLQGVSGLTDLAIGSHHGCGNTSAGLVCWGGNTWKEVSAQPCPSVERHCRARPSTGLAG